MSLCMVAFPTPMSRCMSAWADAPSGGREFRLKLSLMWCTSLELRPQRSIDGWPKPSHINCPRSNPASTDHSRLISQLRRDIIMFMKQLLLRVPEDLHRRIAARAAREGRSMNAVAGAILDASADVDLGIPPSPSPTPQERLRARARALGMLSEVPAAPVSKAERDRIIASTRGIGKVLDRIIAEDREDRL